MRTGVLFYKLLKMNISKKKILKITTIVAINKNPQATMMKMADVAIAADASDLLNNLIKELKKRIRD